MQGQGEGELRTLITEEEHMNVEYGKVIEFDLQKCTATVEWTTEAGWFSKAKTQISCANMPGSGKAGICIACLALL